MALQPPPPELRQMLGGAYKWVVKLLHDLTTVQTQANSAISISGLTLQNNTPSGGKISWSACTLYYLGVAYAIAAGSTSNSELYVTWTVGANTFTPTNNFTPGPTLFVILTNNQGTADVTWDKVGAQSITTGQIANQAVTAAQIANATITNAQIANATILAANIFSVNAGTITAGTLSAIAISACTLTGCTATLNANGTTTTINNASGTSGFAAGIVVQDNSTSWKMEYTPFGLYLFNGSGVARAEMIKLGSDAAELALFGTTTSIVIQADVPKMSMNGIQVLTTRQTGPGNTTDVTDVAVRFNNLLTALRTHGLIT